MLIFPWHHFKFPWQYVTLQGGNHHKWGVNPQASGCHNGANVTTMLIWTTFHQLNGDRFWSFLLIWYQEILYFKTQSYTDTEHFPIRHGGCSALSSTPCLTLGQTMFWAYDIVSYCMGYDILYNICMYIMHAHAPFMHCTCMYMHVYAYIHAVHRYIMIMYV